jgi:hypothetical protein
LRHRYTDAVCTALATAISWSAGALAQDKPADPAYPDALSFAVGYLGLRDDDGSAELRVEYRWGKPLNWKIRPWVGIEPICEGALWVGGGILADFELGKRWMITPGWGMGLFGDSECLELGNEVEFRTQLEFGYRFDSGRRVSFSISHLSNAGLSESNPGTEILNVYYHVPVHQLFRGKKPD